MHPLDPSKGCSPTSLLSISIVKDLLMLADKYNMQVQGDGVQGRWGHVRSSLRGAGQYRWLCALGVCQQVDDLSQQLARA
jgi:hypothetical protein